LLLVYPNFFTVIDSYPIEFIFTGFYADIVSVWRKPDGIRGNSGKNRCQQAKNFVLRKSCFTGGGK